MYLETKEKKTWSHGQTEMWVKITDKSENIHSGPANCSAILAIYRGLPQIYYKSIQNDSTANRNFTVVCFAERGETRGEHQHFSTGEYEHRLVDGCHVHPPKDCKNVIPAIRISYGNLTDGLGVVVESLRVIFLAVECISLLFEAFSLTGKRRNRNQSQGGTGTL